MGTRRTHVLLPEELIQEIDELVGPRDRSAFLVDTARNEVRRQRLLQFLQNKEAGVEGRRSSRAGRGRCGLGSAVES
jgi:metal-responsive CopG/Arc/MetJ family transcriptional regulator